MILRKVDLTQNNCKNAARMFHFHFRSNWIDSFIWYLLLSPKHDVTMTGKAKEKARTLILRRRLF
jgi:hypothetical protein